MKAHKITTYIIFISCLFLSIYFSFQSNTTFTIIWLSAAFLFFALVNPRIIDAIDFGVLSIKLKHNIAGAQKIISLIAGLLLELTQTKGRFPTINEAEKEKTYQDVLSILEDIELPSNQIHAIQQEKWHKWVEHDYAIAIISPYKLNHPVIPKEKLEDWYRKREELIQNIWKIQPDELKRIFESFDANMKEMELYIEDWKYYKANKRHRDIARWENRYHWFQ